MYMYKASSHYKDACEVGKIEYSASYRTLLWWVQMKQKNIDFSTSLLKSDFSNLILVGGGDLCDLFLKEIENSEIKVDGILEDNIKKFAGKYKKQNLVSFVEVNEDFFDNKKVIIMYREKFDFRVKRLRIKGVEIDDIVSVEEIIAFVLYKEKQGR